MQIFFTIWQILFSATYTHTTAPTETKKTWHKQTNDHTHNITPPDDSIRLVLLPNHHALWQHLCAKLPAFLCMTNPSPQCHTTTNTHTWLPISPQAARQTQSLHFVPSPRGVREITFNLNTLRMTVHSPPDSQEHRQKKKKKKDVMGKMADLSDSWMSVWLLLPDVPASASDRIIRHFLSVCFF